MDALQASLRTGVGGTAYSGKRSITSPLFGANLKDTQSTPVSPWRGFEGSIANIGARVVPDRRLLGASKDVVQVAHGSRLLVFKSARRMEGRSMRPMRPRTLASLQN